jgi:hypothetical protein
VPALYVLPSDLQRLPLGVSWASMGQPGGTKPSSDENFIALMDICLTASSLADDEMNQSVRCMLEFEEWYCPSHWASIMQNVGRLVARFTPIVDVPYCAIAYSAQPYPKQWSVLPQGGAWAERTIVGVYGVTQPAAIASGLNGIIVSGGYLTGQIGRYGQQIAACYSHGWPHANLAQPAAAGDQVVQVDEVCGFIGAAATVRDGGVSEDIQVLSVTQPAPPTWDPSLSYFPGSQTTFGSQTWMCTMPVGPFAPSGPQQPGSGAYWTTKTYPTGPGTLNLAQPLTYPHPGTPIPVTALPYSVRWGAALYAKAVGLERGLATVTAPGREGHPASTAEAIEDATVKAVAALRPYARMV